MPKLAAPTSFPAMAADKSGSTSGPIVLSVGSLLFGLVVIGIAAWMRTKGSIDSPAFFKFAGLALILSVGMALIVAGYNQEQIAPMMGLLGTGLGYILGRGNDGNIPGPQPVERQSTP
ncbi:MAG: hypothetical protein KGL39_46105 [Patescibacteria group bacterium]|nr:hypothetical protein [Patescibacteria group bacterium]